MRIEGRTDGHDVAVRNFAKVPKVVVVDFFIYVPL